MHKYANSTIRRPFLRLKGTGFSPYREPAKQVWTLAPEGIPSQMDSRHFYLRRRTHLNRHLHPLPSTLIHSRMSAR
jgi:hypothetical protein